MLSQRDLSRRSFLRRILGAGIGLLSLEFAGGTLAFLWPNITEGLGASFRVGSVDDILLREPRFAAGYPYSYGPARSFLINVPAARALAMGETVDLRGPAASDLLALWRKCPHLGCMVPELCDSVKRFECLCHGSTYNILGEKLEKGLRRAGNGSIRGASRRGRHRGDRYARDHVGRARGQRDLPRSASA